MEGKEQQILEGRTVLVLGAGYLGGELARLAKARGATVKALTRNETLCRSLETAGIEALPHALQSDGWHSLAGDVDYCVLCAGAGPGVDSYRTCYVEGTQSVMRWLQRFRCESLVQTSSTSVYPQGEGAEITEMESVVEPSFEPSGCLVQAERLVCAGAPGLRRGFVLRLAGIYGPGRHQFLDRLAGGEGFASGNESAHLNLIHRDDIVSAVLACWGSAPSHAAFIYNLADQGRATRGEIAAWICAKLGLPPVRFTGEAAPGRRRQTPDRIIIADKIMRELAWRPKYPDFRAGLAELLERGI